MKYGFIFPGTDPNLAVELAPLAEASGWDAFFVWEGIWATDAWAMLAAAAMVTERIGLGTMLTPVPRRRPWELAGQTMTVDRLSNGRVILSVGLGVAAEFDERFWIFEDDPGRKVRAELLDEGLDMLQHLWQGEPFDYEGEHFRAKRTDSMLPPTPVQEPRIPTWVVGVWPRMKSMRRVARYDGWIPNFAPHVDGVDPLEQQRTYTPEIATEAIAWIRAEREQAGLGDRPFDITQEGTTGGVDKVADAAVVRPWADAGVTWWLEANWYVPADEIADYARDRLRAGPPRL
jgi:alkanesulfonate monooxygenase SsuD/methylene tetrahydromethanopterin reductase-like flavin-dependent oxidoreductase (luciferase family)